MILWVFDLDRRISHAWFYDAVSSTWLGEGPGAWWAKQLLHTGGRWFVRLIAFVALVVWLLTFRARGLQRLRRPAAFAFLALLASTSLVGSLKAVTDVDCPWDLTEFGGDRPFVELLADRPDSLPRARCFPGAHASSGFALMFGYFLLRDRSRRAARLALGAGIFAGLLFSLGQEARGAHFTSHDLASAVIVWFVQLLLYRAMLAPRLSPTGESAPRRLTPHAHDGSSAVPVFQLRDGNVALVRRDGGSHAGIAEREHPYGSV
jgi:membrane-associated PAP2 superfamily phosphatase